MPGPLAYFGIGSDKVNLVVNLLLLVVVVIWFALIYWTRADARRRLDDPVLVLCATAAALFPFVGTVVYMIVRPPEYLEDARERDLEIQAAEARLAQFAVYTCPYCSQEVEKDFILCPSCHSRLREPCVHCQRPLDMTWSVCPYCEAHVPGALSAPRRHLESRARESPPAG